MPLDALRRQQARTALVVDDEEALARLVGRYLERDGYDVHTAANGSTALEWARELAPELVVLDLGLPGLDGIELCRRLREFSDCYVIMLTARVQEHARLLGLDAGADDYITKPFSPRELVARARAMRRRPRRDGFGGEPSTVADLRLDRVRREAHLRGTPLSLTPIEFDLLGVLVDHPDEALKRRKILDLVWGEGWVGDEHLVDVHIAHLRRKLGSAQLIETVRGVGYRVRVSS